MLLMLLQNRVWVLDFRTSLIAWIVIGLLAGWIAGLISRGRGFGCLGNIVLGLIGAVLGGWIFSKLGIFGGGTIFSSRRCHRWRGCSRRNRSTVFRKQQRLILSAICK